VIDPGRKPSERTADALYKGALALAIFGVVLLGVYAYTQGSWSIISIGSLLALSVMSIAMLVGFIFGLPRYSTVVISTGNESNVSEAMIAGKARAAAGTFAPGTSLEQISDWFTKLLLGAGLVQLGALGQWVSGLVEGISSALVGSGAAGALPAARVVAGSLLALYGALGFMFGYISTTLWYRRRLNDFLEEQAAS
jgi:hypothetical protein